MWCISIMHLAASRHRLPSCTHKTCLHFPTQDLEGCQDTLIGDEMLQMKGISGGQKRRVGRFLSRSHYHSALCCMACTALPC